jgi:outer membrane protein
MRQLHSPTPTRRPPRRHALAWALAAGCGLAGSTGAGAAGNLLLIEAAPAQARLAVGASLWAWPRYPGARQSTATPLPALAYAHPNGFFASTDDGLGWNLSGRPDVQAGLRLWPQWGRHAADAAPGVGGIGDRLQAEAFANWSPSPVLLLQSGLLQGAGRQHKGLQLELGATSGLPIGADLLGIGLSASYANAAYRNSYFGIDAAQAAASGLAERQPGAGWLDVGLTLSAEHRLSPQWHLGGQLLLARLQGTTAAPANSARPWPPARTQRAGTLTLWRDL